MNKREQVIEQFIMDGYMESIYGKLVKHIDDRTISKIDVFNSGEWCEEIWEYNEVVGTDVLRETKRGNTSKFTSDDLIFMNHIHNRYKWIARDKDGSILAYIDKPVKGISHYDEWTAEDEYMELHKFDYLFENIFPNIKWEDEEPTRIVRGGNEF